MFRNRKVTPIILATILVLSLCPTARGAVPWQINYAGLLMDNTGSPVPDGLYDMRFTLYSALTGGSIVSPATEYASVSVTSGRYSLQLDVNPSVFSSYASVYLAMEVKNGSGIYELLTPRQQLTSSAYAMKAADADTVGGLDSSSFAASAHNHSAANIISGTLDVARFDAYNDLSLSNRLNNDASTDILIRSQLDSRYSLTAHAHSFLNASDGSPVGSLSLDAEGKVYIAPDTTSGGSGLMVSHYDGTSPYDSSAITGLNESGVNIYSEGHLGVLRGPDDLPISPFVNNIGVLGIKRTLGANGVGIYGWNSDDSTENYAVMGIADGAAPTGNNYGIYGATSGALNNYALYGVAEGPSPTGTNYGIYATASGAKTNYAGYFDGNIRVAGNILYSTSVTRYHSLAGSSFIGADTATRDIWQQSASGGFSYHNTTIGAQSFKYAVSAVAVNLPDGANVSGFSCFVRDNSSACDIEFATAYLKFRGFTASSATTMYTANLALGYGFNQAVPYERVGTDSGGYKIVTNSTNAYYIELAFWTDNNSPDPSSCVGIEFDGCRVTYEMSRAGQ